MGKKNVRKQIASLERRIKEHQAKIGIERAKDIPREELIRHWEKEIGAFEKGLRRAQKRLERTS